MCNKNRYKNYSIKEAYKLISQNINNDKSYEENLTKAEKAVYEGYPRNIFSEDWLADEYGEIRNFEDITDKLAEDILEVIRFRKDEEERTEKMKMQRYERGFSDEDAWNINSWFLEVMPKMLQQMRDNLHGYPETRSDGTLCSQALQSKEDNEEDEPGMKKWKEILDRMIFLLQEMDEEKCSYKNPYEEKNEKASEEFRRKYGFFGERFEEMNGIKSDDSAGKRVYFYGDDPEHPEWKELSNKYHMHEVYIAHYRDNCREEFFNLFSRWFWDLWD